MMQERWLLQESVDRPSGDGCKFVIAAWIGSGQKKLCRVRRKSKKKEKEKCRYTISWHADIYVVAPSCLLTNNGQTEQNRRTMLRRKDDRCPRIVALAVCTHSLSHSKEQNIFFFRPTSLTVTR